MIDLGDRVQSEDGSKVQDVMTADQREAPGSSEGGPYPISANGPDGSHRVALLRTTRHDRESMKRDYTPSQKSNDQSELAETRFSARGSSALNSVPQG